MSSGNINNDAWGTAASWLNTATTKAKEFSHSALGKLNWEAIPSEEGDGYDWTEMRLADIGGGKVHVRRSRDNDDPAEVYPAKTAFQAACDTAKVFYGARWFFAYNLLGDLACGVHLVYDKVMGNANEDAFDPRKLYQTQGGRRFITNILGFSYSANLPINLMPGFMEWLSISEYWDNAFFFHPTTAFGFLRYGLMAYALYDPQITKVALNRFEEWYYPREVEPMKWTDFKQLGFGEMPKAIYNGQVTPSAMLGIECLGTDKELMLTTLTTLKKNQ